MRSEPQALLLKNTPRYAAGSVGGVRRHQPSIFRFGQLQLARVCEVDSASDGLLCDRRVFSS